MIDSEASVNVCPKWFGESALEQSDGLVRLRGADGRALQGYKKKTNLVENWKSSETI